MKRRRQGQQLENQLGIPTNDKFVNEKVKHFVNQKIKHAEYPLYRLESQRDKILKNKGMLDAEKSLNQYRFIGK